ncbi:hypothetical protein pipiens_009529 [Culex pipiens pipiens]|uniref:Uncharacterized protein n=1 Tax=Culex pipiens pipiens TaxID=38569 RepID=A0ABD1DDJ6_CULPP
MVEFVVTDMEIDRDNKKKNFPRQGPVSFRHVLADFWVVKKLKLDAMHKQSRNWKLKHQVGRAGHGPRGGLQRVPTGPRGGSGMRQKVNIFKKAARQQSVDVNDMADKSVPRITLEELLDDLVLDDFEMELQAVLKYIRDGWPSSAESVTNSEVLLYFHRRESLSLVDGCVIFHKRVVVPNQFRHQISRQFHRGHPGVDRMKAIARSFVYSTRSGGSISACSTSASSCSSEESDDQEQSGSSEAEFEDVAVEPPAPQGVPAGGGRGQRAIKLPGRFSNCCAAVVFIYTTPV